jgi:hypothetical protein
MSDSTSAPQAQRGPKYILNIEGREVPWDEDTITTEQIAQLKDNNERTLAPNEIVQIKPGHGFGKKVKWKRGR